MADEKPVQGPLQAVPLSINQHTPRSYPGLIGNCNKFCAILQSLGISYLPPNTRITLAKLEIKTIEMTTDHNGVSVLVLPNKEAMLLCHEAFKMMSPYKTRILNALKSSENATKAQILISTNFGKKVDGIRIKAIVVEPVTTDETELEAQMDRVANNTVSHQQQEVLISSFFDFFTYTTGLSCYDTDVVDLMQPAVQAYHDTLTPLMKSSAKTKSDITIARQKRTKSCFDEVTGGIHAFDQSKKYIQSKFFTNSAEFKLVKGIGFYDLRKRADR